MKFADLLFKKYASPHILLDQLLLNGDLCEWLNEFIEAENDEQMWQMWLHRVFDKSFEEFKNSVVRAKPSEEQIETTITNSKSILNGFIPN